MNETVSKKGGSKLIFALIGLVVLAAVLFFLFRSGGSISESEVVARYKEELALLKPFMSMEPEQISASPSERSATMTNVAISFNDVPEFSMQVDKIVQSGIDEDTYTGKPGALSTIERQSFIGIKLLMDGQVVGNMQEYTEEGVELNYRDLVKALRDNQTARAETLLVKLMPALKDYKVARAFGKNFKMDMMFVSASIESMEAKDVSMVAYGPTSLSKFEVAVMGRKVFSVDKLGADAMIMPDMFRELMADPEGYVRNNPDMMRRANTDPLSILAPMEIKNFYIDNLMVDSGSPVTLKKFAADFAISKEDLSLKTALSDLVLTRAFIAQAPELMPLADLVENDLRLDGSFDMALLGMGGAGELVDIALKSSLLETTLGGFSLDMLMDTPKDTLYGGRYAGSDPSRQHIKSFEFSVDNKGIVDFLVGVYAAYEWGGYENAYDEAYEELLDNLYMAEDEAENELQRKAIASIIRMVEEGGSVKLSFKPAKPVSLKALEEMGDDNLENLGFEITYTPPSK